MVLMPGVILMMMNNEEIIKAAVQVFTEAILNIIQNDPHGWSTRPCTSCQTISSMIGRPFGCYKFAKDKNDRQ